MLTKGWGQFLGNLVEIVRVSRQCLHKLHQHLDGREHNSCVGMREAGSDTFTDILGFLGIGRRVSGEGVKDEDLAPLCALIEGGQQLVDGRSVKISQGSC